MKARTRSDVLALIAARDARYARLWGHPSAASAPKAAPRPCLHLGAPTGERIPCGSCASRVELKTFACAVHGACTPAKAAPGVACCASCADYLQPWPLKYTEENLWPGVPGKRFNPSILPHENGYLLAARNGWAGSEIYLGRLDAQFRPAGAPWKLNLRTDRAAGYGAEDPRLFLHAGRVHVAYVGVEGQDRIVRTNVLYARLKEDLTVERVFALEIPNRQSWEKNVSLYSHEGTLYGVYYTYPRHRILAIVGDRCAFAHDTVTPHVWRGGEIRGGASPVRVGEEYWHAFHDRIEPVKGRRIYRTGCLAFEARPPFRVTRMTREPIFTADLTDKPPDQYCYTVFCGGLARDGGDWVFAQGRHDRWLSLDRMSHDGLNERLVGV